MGPRTYGTVVFLQLLRPQQVIYDIGGAVLGVGGLLEQRIYIKKFHFYPFGVPVTPTVLGVGGTELSHVWYGDRPIIDPCQVCFDFR